MLSDSPAGLVPENTPRPAPGTRPSSAAHSSYFRPCLAVYDEHATQRARVERFIQAVYRRRYGARIAAWAPVLVALESGPDILAAAGYRPAGEALFLERYLDAPVEQCLRAHARPAPRRERVVEVGHLAAMRMGAGRRLMPLLGRHLAAAGFEWVVSTATRELRHLLRRMGLSPVVLGQADPKRLGADAAHWGTYYAHGPLVVAGSIAAAISRLERR
jgi:hypothetical protein